MTIKVKGESFIEIGIPIIIQCPTLKHNVVELEPNTDFTEEDLNAFGDPEVESGSGCCQVL